MFRLAILCSFIGSFLTGAVSVSANEVGQAEDNPGTSPTPATDDVRAQAERYFRAGLSLHKLEDFDNAAVAYKASLRLLVTKSALFNLANCQRAMHQYVEALESLERLHAEFREQLVEPMLSKSHAQIQELRNLTGTLLIKTEPDGARVYVDGSFVGETPLTTAVRLKLGEHVIEARLAGYEPKTSTVQLLPRAELTERLVLVQATLSGDGPVAEPSFPSPGEARNTTSSAESKVFAPKAVVPATSDPVGDDGAVEERSDKAPFRPWGWAGLAAGVATLAVGGVVGMQALRLDEELEQACPQGNCPRSRSNDVDRLDRLTVTADVLAGAGALLAVGGAIVVLWASQSDSEREPSVVFNATPTFVGVTTGSSW